MPEGPTLVILKEKLQPFIGQLVVSASGYVKGFDPEILIDHTIKDIKSWGKYLIMLFDGFSIKVHFGLFGSYKINERGRNRASLQVVCNDGEINFYISKVKLIEQPIDEVFDWSTDVMSSGFDIRKARKKLQLKPERMICDALLDQEIFAGSGNIVKNEVLFRTRVHPESKIAFLPANKQREIIKETLNFCNDFYRWRKAKILREHLEAHEQTICPRDHVNFIKADLGKTKRHCYYCTLCQKKYDNKTF
ncbi:endonuclease-8 [Mucilaginibacter oryzae]|uniref:Endonuclease-8 n=1 Tax=Mucilaginibacter oryzae TaxID=468058 RepID=A0A316H9S6_9SPHI|nr:DNA-formamidopyrimidine glycosylase family protein [Mucilaginibacter oryzae]PWK77198.1 endonuclease-8 [Mucilaginibacter oryzae]